MPLPCLTVSTAVGSGIDPSENGAAAAGDLPDGIFRMIVDGTAHPFVVIARDGTIRFAGASVADAIGWSPADLVGRNMVEFLVADDVELAVDALSEIEAIDRSGAGVPMVFRLVGPAGETRWVEVGAMPLLDVPGVDAIALRLRPWEAQQHLDAFLAQLLADQPIDDVVSSLARSIAASLEASGVVVHHGFDGTRFMGAGGFGVPAGCLALDQGPWCQGAATAEALHVVTPDLPAAIAGAATRAGLEGCWVAPVPPSEHVAPSVVTVWRDDPGPPLIGHRHALDRATRYVQLALVRNAEHQRLLHMAGHDELTGVANRTQFRDRLAQALAIGERDIAVAFCDLDQFKPVNDDFGHDAGDHVLVEVADRLRGCLRVGDELARIGGDEFTVLLRNVGDPASALQVADRLMGSFQHPFHVRGEDVTLGLSVGVALARRDMTAEALIAAADAALYEVKRAGGGRAHIAG